MRSPANQRLQVFRLSKSTGSALCLPSPGTWGGQWERSSRPHCLGVSNSKCHHLLFLLFLLTSLSQVLLSSCQAMPAVCQGSGCAMGHTETPRDGSQCPVSVLQVSSREALLADSTAQCLWQ